jgi:hypothetical protein
MKAVFGRTLELSVNFVIEKNALTMSKKARWIMGTIFGAIIGLVYGVVSQSINSVFLPGVPLFAPAPGRFVTVLLAGLAGGALGFLVTWPEEFLLGVLISSVAGTLVSSLLSLQTQAGGSEGIFGVSVVLFITFLPRIFYFIPVVAMIRWAVSLWEKEIGYETFAFRKLVGSATVLVLAAAVLGAFSLYTPKTRHAIKDVNQMILAGRQASSLSSLPQPLQKVSGFLENSNSAYTVKLVNPVTIPISRASAGFDENEVDVEVSFASGFRFGCVYTPLVSQPSCINY